MYIWPDQKHWHTCTYEQKLYWSLRLLQQEVKESWRITMPDTDMPTSLREALILADFAAEDA